MEVDKLKRIELNEADGMFYAYEVWRRCGEAQYIGDEYEAEYRMNIVPMNESLTWVREEALKAAKSAEVTIIDHVAGSALVTLAESHAK